MEHGLEYDLNRRKSTKAEAVTLSMTSPNEISFASTSSSSIEMCSSPTSIEEVSPSIAMVRYCF